MCVCWEGKAREGGEGKGRGCEGMMMMWFSWKMGGGVRGRFPSLAVASFAFSLQLPVTGF